MKQQSENAKSGHEGTGAWIRHRMSFLLLFPFSIWALFVMIPDLAYLFSVSSHIQKDIRQWMSVPSHGTPAVLWLCFLLYHATASLQIMIEDYISNVWMNIICRCLLKGLSFLLVGLIIFGVLWLR